MEHDPPVHFLVGPDQELVDESAISVNAEVKLIPPPAAPPRTWDLNELGQPSWLIQSRASQVGWAWAVLIPPAYDVTIDDNVAAARAIDRREQQLPAWGEDRSLRSLRPIMELGPAMMPVIPWSTPRDRGRHRHGYAWEKTELSIAVAWLKDIRGMTHLEVFRALLRINEKFSTRAARKKVVRYLEAGRQALCNQGVWPWMSAPLSGPHQDDEGLLPERWWKDQDVIAHLQVWLELGRMGGPERAERIRSASVGADDLKPAWW